MKSNTLKAVAAAIGLAAALLGLTGCAPTTSTTGCGGVIDCVL
ncbi:hypothetical protein [Mycobacterium intracellulare]|nr:hypothetical protein [Mycobacterium intracellulare]